QSVSEPTPASSGTPTTASEPAPAQAPADVQKQLDDLKTPTALHYKEVTITPAGSFIEAATVWRSAATGGGINTPPTGIPLEHAGQAQTSEFFAEGRQSRIALRG